jgi:hypothetical protein
MSKTPRRETKTLWDLETAARRAIADRGVLHVSTCWLSYGEAVIHTAMSPMDAMLMAQTIPGFRPTMSYKTDRGATVNGYMTNEETES